MSIVKLNHQFAARRYHLINVMLLGLGLLSMACVLFYNQHIQSQSYAINKAVQQQLHSDKSRQMLRQAASVDREKKIQLEVMRHAVQRIKLPWAELFNGLESVNQQGVQLLAIEPDVKSEKLIIKAVSNDSSSMMRYIENLSQQKQFSSVTLRAQSNTNLMGSPMVEFVVETSWSM